MTVTVDIADRQYDYSDEEKAAAAVAEFQTETGLNDDAVVALWSAEENSERIRLERLIFDAVDTNGSVRRARETIPGGITLSVESV